MRTGSGPAARAARPTRSRRSRASRRACSSTTTASSTSSPSPGGAAPPGLGDDVEEAVVVALHALLEARDLRDLVGLAARAAGPDPVRMPSWRVHPQLP